MKAIIIGSGIAGLTAGSYLAREGNEVIIYEHFSEIGVVTATIHQSYNRVCFYLEGLFHPKFKRKT